MESYRGIISITYEALKEVLGLPSDIEIEFVEEESHKQRIGNIYIRSNKKINGLTFETTEGANIPYAHFFTSNEINSKGGRI